MAVPDDIAGSGSGGRVSSNFSNIGASGNSGAVRGSVSHLVLITQPLPGYGLSAPAGTAASGTLSAVPAATG